MLDHGDFISGIVERYFVHKVADHHQSAAAPVTETLAVIAAGKLSDIKARALVTDNHANQVTHQSRVVMHSAIFVRSRCHPLQDHGGGAFLLRVLRVHFGESVFSR